MVSEHGPCTCALRPSIEEKVANMSWLQNRPTMPTFLPPPPMEEEITAKDIEACYQGYKTLRWDIHEGYSFQEYLIKYVFFTRRKMRTH